MGVMKKLMIQVTISFFVGVANTIGIQLTKKVWNKCDESSKDNKKKVAAA